MKVVPFASSKDFSQIICVVFLDHNDVIYIVLEVIMEYIMKNNSHNALIDSTSILKSKLYDCVMKIAHRSPEGGLLNV